MMMIAPSHGEHGSASLYWGLGLSPSRVQGNWKAESNLKIEQYHALDSTIDHLVLSETSSITAYLLFTYAKTHILGGITNLLEFWGLDHSCSGA